MDSNGNLIYIHQTISTDKTNRTIEPKCWKEIYNIINSLLPQSIPFQKMDELLTILRMFNEKFLTISFCYLCLTFVADFINYIAKENVQTQMFFFHITTVCV